MSQAHIGIKHSMETKEKIGLGNKNKFVTEETKRKISENRKGKTFLPHSDETKRKMSLAHKGVKHKRFNCIYCEKECTPSTLTRWHNNNCKFKV